MTLRRLIPHVAALVSLAAASPGCGSDPQETYDPDVRAVLSATTVTVDSGGMLERRLVGDSARTFLDRFAPDTFTPGPNNVRIVHDCVGGSLTVAGRSYPFSLCRLKDGTQRQVLTVAYNRETVRLIRTTTP